jgi:hypothetical protein
MPIPQVNDRIKEAPAVMLRAVFAGVGQLLLAADKVRARAAGTGWPYDRTVPKGQARAQTRWHTLDEGRSGTVPLARERTNSHYAPVQHTPAGRPGSAASPGSAATEERAAPAASAEPTALAEPADEAGHATPAAARAEPAPSEPSSQTGPAVPGEPGADAPPLDGYDDMSLPSLRGRLRGFDAATLRALLDYEKGHASRDDVISLFERRLAKITAE